MYIRASIAMAVYNGEKFLGEQIDSILALMSEQDELIISYDKSTDNTWNIIVEKSRADSRIKVVMNKNKAGVISNFNNCIACCNGEYIFLADQDDIWINNKIDKMVKLLQLRENMLVICNGDIIDATGKIVDRNLFQLSHISVNPIRNIIKGTYWGCCMAFKRELLELIFPFPDNYDICHDLWIGVLARCKGKIALVNEVCVLHRIHGNNQTHKMRINKIILNRIGFVLMLIKRNYFWRKKKEN